MKTFKTAIRNINKFKSYTAINFVGLVLGLSVFITLISYVAFEFSFDKFHAEHEQIYRISEFATNPKSIERAPTIRVPFAPAFAEQISEIEDYNRVVPRSRLLVKCADKTVKSERLLFADNNFFDFFTFNLNQGPSGLKLTKREIVLTTSLAMRLFGDEEAIGKNVEIQEQQFTVVAVAQVPPKNSHIQFDAVTSIDALLDRPNTHQGWDGGVSAHSFIKLNKYAKIDAVEGKIADFVYEKVNKKDEGSGFFTQFYLEELSHVHLFSNVDWDNFSKAKIKDVLMLLAISILVLLIAVFNFISISKGILAFRAKEFRMKYVLGAGNMEPFRQLFTENLLLLSAAAIVSYVLILSFNASICSLFGYSFDFISIQFGLKIFISAVMLITLAFVSIIAVLQGLKQKSLSDKGNYQGSSKHRNRKLEYVSAFQFVISIALIASVFFIQKQLHYAMNKDLGFQKENIVQFSHYSIGKKQEVLVKEFQNIAGVKNVSATYGLPGLETTRNGYQPEGGEQSYMYNAMYVDENFLETFNINLLEGTNLSMEQSGTKPFLINETLAKSLGWENPIGKILVRNDKHHQVIGVVKDFHIASIYEKIEPLILSMQMQKHFYSLSVLVNGENLPETIDQMENSWAKVMPGLPFDYSFFNDKFANLYKRVERKKTILSIFTIIAVLISMLGIFGVTLLIISGKTKEIGIRKVNGAKVSEILSMLNKDFIKWVAIAFMVACPIAWYAMNKWLQNFAYKTTLSWWIFALAGVLALGIALLTVSWQSWRAATRNPVEALRYE